MRRAQQLSVGFALCVLTLGISKPANAQGPFLVLDDVSNRAIEVVVEEPNNTNIKLGFAPALETTIIQEPVTSSVAASTIFVHSDESSAIDKLFVWFASLKK